MNQRGQSETNRLNLPDREVADKPSFKSSIPQSAIQNLSSTSIGDPKSAFLNPQSKAEVIQKTAKLQMPFIANNGQTNERVKFYANTFGGTVFVTEDGEIVYALPASRSGELGDKRSEARSQKLEVGIQNADTRNQHKNHQTANSKSETQNLNPQSEIRNPKSEIRSVALKEQFVGAKVKTIQGEEKSVTKVNYFKGNDPSKWKTNISTYDMVNLGEIYKGIDLKLKAYGNNVEKLFCVKSGANPEQIKIKLSGVKDCGVQNAKCGIENPKSEFRNPKLWVNEHGELVTETELGPVKFTKPVAYQEINGKRVDVSVEYRVECSEAENKSSKRKTCNSKHMSTNPKSSIQNVEAEVSNPKSKIANRKLEYGFTVASYDKTKDLIIDPLLASTFLGGSYGGNISSIAINSSGNIYVTGQTGSSDFPTTTGAYDTSYNDDGSHDDVFVSELSGDLTSLIASSYLGGSHGDSVRSIAIDSSGNIYVAGHTQSSDFPTSSGAYDIYGGDYYGEAFIAKLNGDLTSLLASTYLGGSSSDSCYSITLDSDGNIYAAGTTESSDFPTTTGAYDTSLYGNNYDGFISKLNGNLTTLLTSTFLGGSDSDELRSINADLDGNVYISGMTKSSDFPTTTDAYDTSLNGNYDVFVSKLNGDLTNLITSTYLGGSAYDYSLSMVIDPDGNLYVTGGTESPDFPITSGAYNTSHNAGVFVSKLSGDLTSLLASTYLGYGDSYSIATDSGGNIYVTGGTSLSDFPATTGSYGGGRVDVFISKLSGDLASLLASTYLGGAGYDIGSAIAIDSGGNIYVAGSTFDESSDFPTTTDAYDTSYDNGGSFITKFDSDFSGSFPTVTTGEVTNIAPKSATLNGTVNANGLSTTAWFKYGINSSTYNDVSSTQTLNGWGNISVSIDVSELKPGTTYYYRIVAQNSAGTEYGNEISFTTSKGKIYGYVINARSILIESVKINLKGEKTKIQRITHSDADGFFEFTDLDADTYVITAKKMGYNTGKKRIRLKDGQEKEVGIEIKKVTKGI